MCLSDIILLIYISPIGYRACKLRAIAQVSVSCTDTVSYLFPEQAEAQLSATTQGTSTEFTVYTAQRHFDKDIFTARVHVGAFSLCSCDCESESVVSLFRGTVLGAILSKVVSS